MPLYDYRCGGCQHHYERREGFDAPSLQVCPACGAEARRVLHAPPIVFKGSGFYSTDHRNSSSGDSDSDSPAKGEEKASDTSSSAKEASTSSPKADSPQAESKAAS